MGAKVEPGGPITERADVVELLDKVPLTKLEEDTPKQVCCVTGATSLVGAHIVRRLLRAGHDVHAPVRGSATDTRLGYLKAMPGAAEHLKFFGGADLMVAGSYDESMVGCTTVFHVASPFFLVGSKKKVKEKLIDPAVIGTENILASCSKAPSVTRVVLTGTVLAASCDFRASKKDKNFTVSEKDWEQNTTEKTIPYVYSKVVAEKKAEEIAAKQSRWTLVVLLIAGTFGPPCSGKGDGVPCMFMKYTRMGLFFPACPPMVNHPRRRLAVAWRPLSPVCRASRCTISETSRPTTVTACSRRTPRGATSRPCATSNSWSSPVR